MSEPKPQEEYRGGLTADFDAEGGIEAAEPWEPWETKLVWYSIGIGIAGLVILGVIINATIL
ncbi:MAG: hypothetical protein H0Z39_03085 [Peptococcaceae bacterium]|nr:hypothetical protein [Peptococcaceae bacterium]